MVLATGNYVTKQMVKVIPQKYKLPIIFFETYPEGSLPCTVLNKNRNDRSPCYHVDVIFKTWETVFHQDIQTARREFKYDTQQSIFDEIQGVWIADETVSRMFDISSQSKQKLRGKRKSKSVKIYAN